MHKSGLASCIVLFVFSVLNASCSDGTTSGIEDSIDPNDTEQVKELLSNVSTSWGASRATIQRQMNGYTTMVEEDDFLKYTNGDKTLYLSYEFTNDSLQASLVLLPQTDGTETSTNIPMNIDQYTYIGETGGASIYAEESSNTMVAVLSRDLEGQKYMAYGFTPIESDFYEDIEPIIVQPSEPSAVGTLSITLNASFSGINSVESAYFYYSTTDATLKTNKQKTATIASSSFYASISSLSPNSTVYFQPAIKVDGIEYVGTISSAKLESIKTYSIGDAYPNEQNAIGVVWNISNEGASGKIISLVEGTRIQWDLYGIFCKDYNCNDSYNGSYNNMGSTLPFAKWIKSLGDGWYGPAYKELLISNTDLALVNAMLRKLGKKEVDGFYWSSTEISSDYNQAWVTTVTETKYLGYENGQSFNNSKDQEHPVRGMKKF